jgi:hypothetical protein
MRTTTSVFGAVTICPFHNTATAITPISIIDLPVTAGRLTVNDLI